MLQEGPHDFLKDHMELYDETRVNISKAKQGRDVSLRGSPKVPSCQGVQDLVESQRTSYRKPTQSGQAMKEMKNIKPGYRTT